MILLNLIRQRVSRASSPEPAKSSAARPKNDVASVAADNLRFKGNHSQQQPFQFFRFFRNKNTLALSKTEGIRLS